MDIYIYMYDANQRYPWCIGRGSVFCCSACESPDSATPTPSPAPSRSLHDLIQVRFRAESGQGFHLKATARIWPGLYYMCRIARGNCRDPQPHPHPIPARFSKGDRLVITWP